MTILQTLSTCKAFTGAFAIVKINLVCYTNLELYGGIIMKKLISLLSAVLIILTLSIPCFALSPAKFNITLVSEDNSTAVVSVDFAGGTAFSNFDFEMKVNEKKLKATSAVTSDNVDAFLKELQMNNNAGMAVMNPDTLKATFASTSPYKNTKGKDLFVITFKKLSKEKITADDISVTFSCCGYKDGTSLKVEVTNTIGSGTASSKTTTTTTTTTKSDKTTAAVTKNGTTAATTSAANIPSAASTEISDSSELITNGQIDPDTITDIADETAAEENNTNSRKIIAVACAAVFMVIIIVAVCLYVVKKTKKVDGEEN